MNLAPDAGDALTPQLLLSSSFVRTFKRRFTHQVNLPILWRMLVFGSVWL